MSTLSVLLPPTAVCWNGAVTCAVGQAACSWHGGARVLCQATPACAAHEVDNCNDDGDHQYDVNDVAE